MNESDRKILTNQLGECWHEWGYVRGSVKQEIFQCVKCGETCKGIVNCHQKNRTFDNRSDLMDLYQQVYEDGKWDDFFWDFAFKRKPENYGLGEAETSVWLFCLDGKDYEAQCKMVAAFYGWEEK